MIIAEDMDRPVIGPLLQRLALDCEREALVEIAGGVHAEPLLKHLAAGSDIPTEAAREGPHRRHASLQALGREPIPVGELEEGSRVDLESLPSKDLVQAVDEYAAAVPIADAAWRIRAEGAVAGRNRAGGIDLPVEDKHRAARHHR